MNIKQGIFMMMLGFAGGIFGGYVLTQLTFKALKAEQYYLTDKKGKIYAILGVTNIEEPSLGIWDTEGKNRVNLGFITKESPGIGINDADGNRRLSIQLGKNGDPEIVFFDKHRNRIWSAPPKE